MSQRVFFGRLAREVQERDLEKLLRPYGSVRDVYVRDGFGFAEFAEFKDADDCVYELNNSEFFGERIIVEMARTRRERDRENEEQHGTTSGAGGERPSFKPRPPEFRGPPVRTPNRLICENIPLSVSWQDLKDFVRPVAEATFADVHKYRRGEGILEFASYGEMKAVLEKLQDAELFGSRVRLFEPPTTMRNFAPRREGNFHHRWNRDRSPRRNAGFHRFGRSPRRDRSPPRRGYSPSSRDRSFSPRRGPAHGAARTPPRYPAARSPHEPAGANGVPGHVRTPPRYDNGRPPHSIGSPRRSLGRSPPRYSSVRSPYGREGNIGNSPSFKAVRYDTGRPQGNPRTPPRYDSGRHTPRAENGPMVNYGSAPIEPPRPVGSHYDRQHKDV